MCFSNLLITFTMATVLTIFFSTTSAQKCPRRTLVVQPTLKDIEGPEFCIRKLSIGGASSVQIFANRSCLLTDMCCQVTQPVYMRLSPGASLVLLHSRADTLISSSHLYDLITSEVTNTTQPKVEELRGRALPFLSPLMTFYPPPFTRLHVQLFDELTGSDLVADLSFRVDTADVLRDGVWFSEERLVGAEPWNASFMKRQTLKKFSMAGYGARKFAINFGEKCDMLGMDGYVFLYYGTNRDKFRAFSARFFTYEIFRIFPEIEIHNSNLRVKAREAIEFKILGKVRSLSDPLYVRVQ